MAQANASAEQGIRCLLIPLTDFNLLLPGSVIAEVAGYRDPTPLPDVDPESGVMGRVTWRGVGLPLVSVDRLVGFSDGDPGARARLIVLKGLAGYSEMPFYAVLAHRIPRQLYVTPGMLESLEDESLDGAPGDVVLAGGEPAVILDVERIERRVHDALYT